MTILKNVTVAALLVGGTSLAMAQNGLPTGGEPAALVAIPQMADIMDIMRQSDTSQRPDMQWCLDMQRPDTQRPDTQRPDMRLDTQRLYTQRPDTRLDMQRLDMRLDT